MAALCISFQMDGVNHHVFVVVTKIFGVCLTKVLPTPHDVQSNSDPAYHGEAFPCHYELVRCSGYAVTSIQSQCWRPEMDHLVFDLLKVGRHVTGSILLLRIHRAKLNRFHH